MDLSTKIYEVCEKISLNDAAIYADIAKHGIDGAREIWMRKER